MKKKPKDEIGELRRQVEENACVEDGMTHEEYMEHKYEKQSQEQRRKYGESNRDIEERNLNDHLKARGDGNV